MKKGKEIPEIKEEHILRRWDLKLRSLRFQNLLIEPKTVFLHFSIGCSKLEVSKVSQAGKKQKVFEGHDGITYKSELLKEVESGEVRVLKRNYETEYWATYEMIESLFFEIDIWEYSRWRLNKFLGKLKVSLAELCNGSLNRCDNVKVPGGFRKNVCRIWYTFYLQEIWDFKITFSEWRADNIFNSKQEPINSKLKLALQTLGFSTPVIRSDIKEKESTPYWDNFNDKKIFFRGTLDDLEDLNLKVELRKWGRNNFLNPYASWRLISLRGVSLSGYIKTTLKFNTRAAIQNEELPSKMDDDQGEKHLEEKLNNRKFGGLDNEMVDIELNNEEHKNIEEGDLNEALAESEDQDSGGSDNENRERKEEEENELFMKGNRFDNVSRVEGRVNLNRLPKYRQKGELIRFKKNQFYLCVLVNRVENVLAPDDRGIIDSFVTLDWGGNIKKTQTYEDSNNPDFNEEIIFKIPIKAQKKKIEKLRDELRARSEINLSLWIDGGDKSNENLGYVRFLLSELANAPKEEKSYEEYYSGKQMVKLVWFFPDIPDEINMRDFNQEFTDRYPKDIQKEMSVRNVQELEDNYFFGYWEKQIKDNFKSEILEKKINSLFFRFIYVKDQYGRLHFASKYVDKYLMDDVLPPIISQLESTGESAIKVLSTTDSIAKKDPRNHFDIDTKTKTFAEISHYISTIPYSEERLNNDVWLSPNFVFMLRKGSMHDHTLLMASLFMGAKAENEEELEKQNSKKADNKLFNRAVAEDKTPEIQDRVFVCIGTLKRTRDFCSWVMTINQDLNIITFWDPCLGKNYELEGRVTDPGSLGEYLTRKTGASKQENKNQEEKMLPSLFKNIFKSNKKAREENLDTSLQDEKDYEEGLAHRKKTLKKIMDNKEEIAEILEDKFFKLNDIDPYFKRDLKKSEADSKDDEKTSKHKYLFDEEEKKKKTESNNLKSQFLMDYKKEQERSIKEDKNKRKLVPVDTFYYPHDSKISPGEKVPDPLLPFASIEIIFNNKNIYANLQNQDPARINYNIQNQDEWLPYIRKRDNLGQQNVNSMRLGTFYESVSPGEPFPDEMIKKLVESINRDIMVAVINERNREKLVTKWKHKDDKTNRQLLRYARLLENNATCRIKEFNREQESWIANMKKLMPLNYKMKMIPMSFNFIQPERIRSLVITHAQSVYMKVAKVVYLGLATKIFPYPNKFNNVRIMIASYFKEESGKDSGDESEYEEIISEEEPIKDLNEDSERKDLIGKEIFVPEQEDQLEGNGKKTIFSRSKKKEERENDKGNLLEDIVEEY